MGSWSTVFDRLQTGEKDPDIFRGELISRLGNYTDRNVICYYSGWLQKDAPAHLTGITDDDMNGLMNAVHGLERSKGVDLLLHTPGGDIAATEAIVEYLRSCFPSVRAIVPQLAMSAGTMIACACDEIVMGKESSLGPTDPQLRGVAAGGVIEEFDRAVQDIRAFPQLAALWQSIIAQYGPTFLGDCEKAVEASRVMISKWLEEYMFAGAVDAPVGDIVDALCTHASSAMHNRHFSAAAVASFGLKVTPLEDDQELQEIVLSLHHVFMATFALLPAIKIIESSNGKPWVKNLIVSTGMQ